MTVRAAKGCFGPNGVNHAHLLGLHMYTAFYSAADLKWAHFKSATE